jgi:hypothetical protein
MRKTNTMGWKTKLMESEKKAQMWVNSSSIRKTTMKLEMKGSWQHVLYIAVAIVEWWSTGTKVMV